MKFSLKCLALAALIVGQVSAQDTLRLGAPAVGGTGCPIGTASATVSPDQQSLSILFDQFSVAAGQYKRTDRKSCNIAIPVYVPQGFSVSILKVDYRGFNSLPRGAKTTVSSEYFFAGSTGPKTTKTFYGPVDSDYLINNELQVSALVWSACGASTNIRINTSVLTQSTLVDVAAGIYADTLSTLDSIDLNSGIVYHLKWKRCL